MTSVTIGIPVSDLGAAAEWYERCLELQGPIEPTGDIREYQVFPGCWLQLSETPSAETEHCVLLGVADLEKERSRLLEAGVEVGDIERVEGVVAFCDFKDPDGNKLGFYRVASG